VMETGLSHRATPRLYCRPPARCGCLEQLVRFYLETLSLSMVTLGVAIVLEMQRFVRVKQAASMLGVSPNTVRAWGASGKVPEYRHPVNNYRLYKLADLRKILRQLEKSVSSVRQLPTGPTGAPTSAAGSVKANSRNQAGGRTKGPRSPNKRGSHREDSST
jgi:hypothetical protein